MSDKLSIGPVQVPQSNASPFRKALVGARRGIRNFLRPQPHSTPVSTLRDINAKNPKILSILDRFEHELGCNSSEQIAFEIHKLGNRLQVDSKDPLVGRDKEFVLKLFKDMQNLGPEDGYLPLIVDDALENFHFGKVGAYNQMKQLQRCYQAGKLPDEVSGAILAQSPQGFLEFPLNRSVLVRPLGNEEPAFPGLVLTGNNAADNQRRVMDAAVVDALIRSGDLDREQAPVELSSRDREYLNGVGRGFFVAPETAGFGSNQAEVPLEVIQLANELDFGDSADELGQLLQALDELRSDSNPQVSAGAERMLNDLKPSTDERPNPSDNKPENRKAA